MQKTNRFSRLLAVLVAVFMAVCCLPLSAFAEGGTNTPASITLSFKNEKDETVGEGVMNAPSLGDHRFSEVQDQVPAGYALADPEGIFNVNTETKGITVPVIATEGTMYIYFVCGDDIVGDVHHTLALGNHNYSELAQFVPEGYQMTVSGDFMVTDGGELKVAVEKIVTEVNMNIRFMDGDTFIADGDYMLTVGTHNYSELAQYVPAGYRMTASGDFQVPADGGQLDVNVEKITDTVVMNIRFMEGDTFIAGGDYMLPAGVQNYSILEQYVPAGYKMTVTGDFQVTAGGKLDVNVEKITDTVVMNIRFMEGENFIAGGDYMLPAGVQNYSILEQYVPEGYEMDVMGDFMAAQDAKLEVPVHKIADEPEDKPEDKPGEGGGDNGSDSSTPAAGTNDNGSNAQNGQTDAQVVKADVPADNSTKIMPQTGLSAEKPVVFGAMMVTGLGSAAAYLFVLRKKLN